MVRVTVHASAQQLRLHVAYGRCRRRQRPGRTDERVVLLASPYTSLPVRNALQQRRPLTACAVLPEGGCGMTDRRAGGGKRAVLEALLAANVQFVVIGEPGEPGDRAALRLVVSRHPTNLRALGTLLERLQASLRVADVVCRSEETTTALADTTEADRGIRRIGDAFATVAVRALGADVDLMLGGSRRSLYAEALGAATDREIFGILVKWAPAAPDAADAVHRTGTSLGRRLLSIAEGLAHFVERGPEPPRASEPTVHGDVPPADEDVPDGEQSEN